MNYTRTTAELTGAGLTTIGVWVCLALGWSLQAQAQQPRMWRDNTGNYDVMAVLQSVSGASITLQLLDGRTVAVPIRRLSAEDLDFVHQFEFENVAAIASKESLPETAVRPVPTLPATVPPMAEPELPVGVPLEFPPGPSALDPVLPNSVTILVDPEFRHADEPPLEWTPAKPEPAVVSKPNVASVPMIRPAATGGLVREVEPTNPEKLLLIGPAPRENGRTGSELNKPLITGTAETAEAVSGILPPEPEPGMAVRSTAEREIESMPSLIPGNPFGSEIIAPEIPEGVASSSRTGNTSVNRGSVSGGTMPASLQTVLNALLAEMRMTTDNELLRRQLVKLSQLPISPGDGPTLAVLRQHLGSKDKYIRETVFQKIVTLSTTTDIETIRIALVDESQAIRWKAYNQLSSDPVPELLPLLVERVQDYDRSKIISVIKVYGEAAEPAVWPLLESDNPGLRLDIARLLSDFGTAQSLPVLNRYTENSSLPLVEILQAKAAIRAIENR